MPSLYSHRGRPHQGNGHFSNYNAVFSLVLRRKEERKREGGREGKEGRKGGRKGGKKEGDTVLYLNIGGRADLD